jgi:hypothetical protein
MLAAASPAGAGPRASGGRALAAFPRLIQGPCLTSLRARAREDHAGNSGDGRRAHRALAHDARPCLARIGEERAPLRGRFQRGARHAVRQGPKKEVAMTDLSIVVLTAALFGAAFFFVRLCERM